MATTKTTRRSVARTNSNPVDETNEVSNVKSNKKFEPSEGIPCRSITTGGLYMEGIKSHILYEWAEEGDYTDVEYQDLLAAIRSNSGYVMSPKIIVDNDDFIDQNPKLKSVYENMYSFKELRDVIFDLNAGDMKATILSLPKGAQTSIKDIAAKLVSNGELDSVSKIKALDEIFGTELVQMTGLND